MSKVVVIGAGYWGKNLVRTFHELGALAGVAEANLQLRESITLLYPDIRLYEDYHPVLESDVSAIVIATPAQTHFTIAKEALLKGKDVFVEKPMTLSLNEAEELVKLAESNKCIFMVGHLLLYQPAIQIMKELITTGVIGTLHSLHQERLKLGKVRSVENVLWSFGVHDLAVLLYLVGEEPSWVQVNGQAMIQPITEDDIYLHLGFPNGVRAHLHTSWLWPELQRRLVAIGSEGMLVYDEEAQTVTLHRKGINSDLSNRDEGAEVVYCGEKQPLSLECSHFLRCIQERQRPISDGRSGLEVIRILEKASHGVKEGDYDERLL